MAILMAGTHWTILATILAVGAVVMLLTGCSKPTEPVELPDDALLIDVRTPSEFAAGHAEGALNIPLDTLGGRFAELVPSKSTTIVVYCRSGRRSGLAQQQLSKMGYQNVTNGGAVGAVVKATGKPLRKGDR